MLAEYRKRRDFVVQRLRQIPGVSCAEPRGRVLRLSEHRRRLGASGIANTLQFSERLLEEAHVAVVPGEAFGTDKHVRISYATSMHELERGSRPHPPVHRGPGVSDRLPVRLPPSFHPKIWGATDLQPWFPPAAEKIGEVWFPPRPEVPILVKFLFTSARLSVQVHPKDDYARRHENSAGKTEMWHILRADPGAEIALGFREPISRERLREASVSGEIEKLLRWIPVAPGETYFTPAGTVHAIGGGLALCEIQQVSDVTYRLYDYGRPRELHLDKGVEVSDLGPHPGAQSGRPAICWCECPYFRTERLDFLASAVIATTARTC